MLKKKQKNHKSFRTGLMWLFCRMTTLQNPFSHRMTVELKIHAHHCLAQDRFVARGVFVYRLRDLRQQISRFEEEEEEKIVE